MGLRGRRSREAPGLLSWEVALDALILTLALRQYRSGRKGASQALKRHAALPMVSWLPGEAPSHLLWEANLVFPTETGGPSWGLTLSLRHHTELD